MIFRRIVTLTQALTLAAALIMVVFLFAMKPTPVAPISTAAQGLAPSASPEATVDLVAMGAALYETQCDSCHGKYGEGVYAPVTVDAITSASKFPDPTGAANQAAVVSAGQGQMPGFADRLSPEQIDAVVAYIRQLS